MNDRRDLEFRGRDFPDEDTRDADFPELDVTELDEERLHRDDALLDAIGQGELPQELDDDPLLLTLAQWRDDLDFNQPTAPLVEVLPRVRPATDPLAPRVVTARRGRGDRTPSRGSRLAVVLTSVVVLLGGGVTVAAASAQPGSPLWPLSEIVYADRATALQAATDARAQMDTAQQALDDDRPADAARALLAAETLIGKVRAEDRPELVQRFEQIRTRLITMVADLIPPPPTAPASPAEPVPASTAAPTIGPSNAPEPGAAVPTPSPLDGGLLDLLPSLLDPLLP